MTLGVFFTALGYLVGGVVFYVAARARRLATEGIWYIVVAGVCGGVIGAKLTEWFISNPHFFASHPQAFLDPRTGGRTIIGGIVSGWISVEITKWWLGIRRSTGDLFALALPAGEVFGRIGCFFNTCCYGIECHLPWAVYQHGAWRHPTQIYASILAFGIFIILFSLRNKMEHEGDLFKIYLFLYGVTRFFLEFFRAHDSAFWGLSLAQWTCLEIVVFAVIALKLTNNRRAAIIEGASSS